MVDLIRQGISHLLILLPAIGIQPSYCQWNQIRHPETATVSNIYTKGQDLFIGTAGGNARVSQGINMGTDPMF